MPRLWDDTIDAHRRAVRDATLDATAALVARLGARGVTMSRIAEEAGIGRATLYKYFPDVEAILVAWHERQIAGHLEHLTRAGERVRDPIERLDVVLEAYALIHHELAAHHRQPAGAAADLVSALHQGEHVARAQQQVHRFVREVLGEAARAGAVRGDVPLDELTRYCLTALTGASTLSSKAAVRRLVEVTLTGLRAPA